MCPHAGVQLPEACTYSEAEFGHHCRRADLFHHLPLLDGRVRVTRGYLLRPLGDGVADDEQDHEGDCEGSWAKEEARDSREDGYV